MEKKSTKIAYFVALGIFVVLLVIRAIMAKKHAGIFQEMAEANKALSK